MGRQPQAVVRRFVRHHPVLCAGLVLFVILVVSVYAPDGTRLINQLAWNVTGQHIDIGGDRWE